MPTRRSDKFVQSRWDTTIAVGQLLVGEAQIVSLTVNDEDIFHINGNFLVAIDNFDADDPALLFGLCPRGDQTATEIASAINLDGPANQADSDKISTYAKTPIYTLGLLNGSGVEGTDKDHAVYLENKKLGFKVYNEGLATLGTGGILFWVYNAGLNTLATGKTVRICAEINSRWD